MSFEKKVIEHKMCVLIFYTTATFPIVRRSERDVIKNVHISSCKLPVILRRI